MSFDVKIEVFEGPFDLLLQLILRRELDICDVPIADITDSYIAHIQSAPRLDLETATEFLIIAASLLLIKARALLEFRGRKGADEETETVTGELAEKIIKYSKFRNAADWLGVRYAEHGLCFSTMRELESAYSSLYPDPFGGITADKLASTLIDLLLENLPAIVDTSYIAPIRVSVAEHINKIRDILKTNPKTSFSEITRGLATKIEIIAAFLAVLELFKDGEISVRQPRIFGEIEIALCANGERGGEINVSPKD